MSHGQHTLTCVSNLPGGRHPCNCPMGDTRPRPVRFIGGDSHGEPVPAVDQHQYAIIIGIQRYVRHGGHFVIFGMTPHRAAELIGEL